MQTELKITGLDGVLDTLRSLPAEVVSKRGGPVKLSLAKGARHLRDRAKENLERAIAENGDESSGLLVENVISSRGKPPIGSRGERYLVRVRRKTYPDRTGKPVTTRKTAHLLEYGAPGGNQPPYPWLRPTVRQEAQRTVDIVTTDLRRRIDLAVKKLAAKNKGK